LWEGSVAGIANSGDGGRHLVAKIVSSNIKHNRVAANELPTVIASPHQSLSSLGNAPTPNEPINHPIAAPDYSARRSAVAKKLGLGCARRAAETASGRRLRSRARDGLSCSCSDRLCY